MAALFVAAPSRAHEGHDGDAAAAAAPAAPAAERRLYEPPAPGSYALPTIHRVRDHELLDAAGAPARVLDLAPEAVAVVAFVYTNCTDATGCPLSLATLKRLDGLLAERPDLSRRTRLVTVSFDPAVDTPERMASLREHLAPRSDWRFLTARDEAALAPVLADFGQDVQPAEPARAGAPQRLRHVLRVYLVDGHGAVRNIYSTGFLDARLLLADVETVLDGG